MFVLDTSEALASDIGLSLGRLDRALLSGEVYSTVSFGNLEYREMVERRGVFDVTSLCVETG
jgi:hypothetical protein